MSGHRTGSLRAWPLSLGLPSLLGPSSCLREPRQQAQGSEKEPARAHILRPLRPGQPQPCGRAGPRAQDAAERSLRSGLAAPGCHPAFFQGVPGSRLAAPCLMLFGPVLAPAACSGLVHR